jgi:pyruvate formate lyase activating enzyme
MPLMTASRARHWVPFKENRAECRLCPRHCRPKNSRKGFCGVRGTLDGMLKTFNYGKSLAATEEVIETEAIHHFSPGARILSLGNIGCSMACSFCQNWETSQTRHLDTRLVRDYTPEQVVELCLENNIPVLSWTYNDPVVWHEFVVQTSQLAQQQGIKTLYKSAFYIERAPVDELIECMDVFSISLKSLDDTFYRKVARSRLQPVLQRIEQVAASHRHLELSQLVIPALNDRHEDIRHTISWILEHLGDAVPLHFVAFHPAYQYTRVGRTPLSTLLRARSEAKSAGIKHVYLGNTFEADLNDTCCEECGSVLVKRYGLFAETNNLAADSRCRSCGTLSPIKQVVTSDFAAADEKVIQADDLQKRLEVRWSEQVQSIHILKTQGDFVREKLRIRSLGCDRIIEKEIASGLDRFIVSRSHARETGVVVSWNSASDFQQLALLDRAHYPTATSLAAGNTEAEPLQTRLSGCQEKRFA